MRPLDKGFLYTACCAFALGLPINTLAQGGEQAAPRDPQTLATKEEFSASSAVKAGSSPAALPAEQTAASELPDSPGTGWSTAQDASPPQSSSSQTATPSSGQTGTSPTMVTQDQGQKNQRPVGTAAAEAPKVKGVTAAQPSGVAIAPAKQRRVRTMVLKVGALIGAGAAVGTVIALTKATSSRPPGAH